MTLEPPASGVRTATVPDDREGQRLDNFLLGQLKGAPRSLIYKLVRSGQVRINGKRAKPDSRLEGGDLVRIPPVALNAAQPASAAPASMLERLEAAIVFEDERLLALDKPSGVASHGGSGISFGAIEALRQLRPQQELELAHRLDRDTSGVLVIAKKRSALTELQALMREDDDRGVPGLRKRYLALLVGRMAGNDFTVDAPLDIGLRQGGQRHVRVAPGGKPSVSHFHLIERRGGHSYVDVRIETGRTHQIRAHAAHLGHAVAGDDKYGDKDVNRRLKEQVGLKRLFLHAACLEFSLDGGRRPYRIEAPLAADLAQALARLG
ncbi:MAG: RluA family pseudouridine synthase [Proteobacteria bacterium]|nr:RluA family pseudouridine synthase [Pseudomonadota bacterium]